MSCIFCRIANGEIPSNTVYEDEDFSVIMDIAPANLGHCLVLPKKHAANIFEMDEKLVGKAHKLAKRVAEAVQASVNCDGINILQNNGEAAGQSVEHYHVHIIPRLFTDDVNIGFGTFAKPDDETYIKLCEEIKSRLD